MAIAHFNINSFSLEFEFKPEPPILSNQVLNFVFTNSKNGSLLHDIS